MKIKLIRSYRSKNGNVVFVYEVDGTAKELAAYKKAQGKHYVESDETGAPLYFTVRCVGDFGKLIITQGGKVVPDMSEFDKAASMAEQFGGNFGQELARQAAASLLGKSTASSAVESPQEKETAKANPNEDLTQG